MNPWVVPLALLAGVVLAGTAFSALALLRAHSLLRQTNLRHDASEARLETALATLGARFDALAADLEEIERSSPATPSLGALRTPMNLSKRAQVLRMHRHGETVESIAAALEIPRQEVDLLVKVHRIVLSNI